MQVVDREREWAALGEVRCKPVEAVQHGEGGVLARGHAVQMPYVEQRPSEPGGPVEERVAVVARRARDDRLEELAHEAEGKRLLELAAAPSEHTEAASGGSLARPPEQARLADSGCAFDGDDTAGPAGDCLDGGVKRGKLGFPLEQLELRRICARADRLGVIGGRFRHLPRIEPRRRRLQRIRRAAQVFGKPFGARPYRPHAPARIWTLAITSLALFMAVLLDNLAVPTALPVIRTDLGASVEELEWTVNAYTLTFAVLLLTGAALGGIALAPMALLRLRETYGTDKALDLPGLALVSAGLLGLVWGLVNRTDVIVLDLSARFSASLSSRSRRRRRSSWRLRRPLAPVGLGLPDHSYRANRRASGAVRPAQSMCIFPTPVKVPVPEKATGSSISCSSMNVPVPLSRA
ncbi:MAG TPA: hypothetical protein VFX80_02460 [Solirubrobacteraceae bacterium]|nr:hypothetical protein [Solirubrobacteraceae bacterium]